MIFSFVLESVTFHLERERERDNGYVLENKIYIYIYLIS